MHASPIRRSVIVQQSLAYLRQVDRHSRTVEQFQRALALTALPEFPAQRVVEVIEAMAQETGVPWVADSGRDDRPAAGVGGTSGACEGSSPVGLCAD